MDFSSNRIPIPFDGISSSSFPNNYHLFIYYCFEQRSKGKILFLYFISLNLKFTKTISFKFTTVYIFSKRLLDISPRLLNRPLSVNRIVSLGTSLRILVTFNHCKGRSLLIFPLFLHFATGQERRASSCMHSALARKRRGTLPP